MTGAVLYVMLIWTTTVSPSDGGLATVQNFSSLENCERARPIIEQQIPKGFFDASYVRTQCVAINNN